MIHPNDVERWRSKLEQIEAAVALDAEVQQKWRDVDALRPARNAEARKLVADLAATKDFKAFRTAADAWCRQDGPYKAFRGFGQMWLNQVANNLPDDPAVVDVLVHAFTTPASREEAQQRFDEVERVTRDLASKGQPAVGRIPYVLSVFWATDSSVHPGWPILWKSAPERMYDLGWVTSWSNSERYVALLDVAHTFYPDDAHEFERLMWFITERERFVGLNPALADMCAEAAQLMDTYSPGVGYADEATTSRAASLAAQLKGELGLATVGLLEDVRSLTGLDLEKSQLQLKVSFDQAAAYRADAYATWSLPGGMSSPGFRLWATKSGLALGVYGGWGGGSQHDYDDTANADGGPSARRRPVLSGASASLRRPVGPGRQVCGWGGLCWHLVVVGRRSGGVGAEASALGAVRAPRSRSSRVGASDLGRRAGRRAGPRVERAARRPGKVHLRAAVSERQGRVA